MMKKADPVPACDHCGRRHGERVLVAALSPLEWGQTWVRWAWLDPNPPACLKREGPVWRETLRFCVIPEEQVRGPRQWQVVELTEYVPPRGWDYTDGSLVFYCQTCADFGRELVEECEFTRRPLPLDRMAPEQPRLLEVVG